MNFAALARPRDLFLSSLAPFGTKRDEGTSAPYTAARHATNGRRAHHRWSVEMCPLRTDFSREASAEMATIGK
jgi:hypothetical protein